VTSSAHRKVVTLLFCDVVGSTALGESVDPEALQGGGLGSAAQARCDGHENEDE
jgi:hypothetical protein